MTNQYLKESMILKEEADLVSLNNTKNLFETNHNPNQDKQSASNFHHLIRLIVGLAENVNDLMDALKEAPNLDCDSAPVVRVSSPWTPARETVSLMESNYQMNATKNTVEYTNEEISSIKQYIHSCFSTLEGEM